MAIVSLYPRLLALHDHLGAVPGPHRARPDADVFDLSRHGPDRHRIADLDRTFEQQDQPRHEVVDDVLQPEADAERQQLNPPMSLDIAQVGLQDTGQQHAHGALARTVTPDQPQHLAAVDVHHHGGTADAGELVDRGLQLLGKDVLDAQKPDGSWPSTRMLVKASPRIGDVGTTALLCQGLIVSLDDWQDIEELRTDGACTYGYNNQVGLGRQTPPADTIVVMDYENWEIDRNRQEADDPPHYVAPRHGGRVNVLFGDGRVETIAPESIRDGMFTVQSGD